MFVLGLSAAKKGPGEEGAREYTIQKLRLRKWPISSADFLSDSYEKNRAPLRPFLGEGFWGHIRRLLPAPLFYWQITAEFGGSVPVEVVLEPMRLAEAIL